MVALRTSNMRPIISQIQKLKFKSQNLEFSLLNSCLPAGRVTIYFLIVRKFTAICSMKKGRETLIRGL